jgi:regulator of sirC expression with transglutaminase-like and TPR domain
MKPITESGARALLSLLVDEDRAAVDLARNKLMEAGPAVLDLLQDAEHSDDARLRVRVRPLIEHLRQKGLEREFELLVRRESPGDVDLEAGACLIARFGDSGVDGAAVSAELDRIAALVTRRLPDSHDALDALELTNQVIFRELGFEGNTSDYYDPDNSYLHRVLERRTGLPITLSVVYLLVGRRIGLPVHGVGMPSHFLVKVDVPCEEVFVDPFNRGMCLTREDCLERIGTSSEGFAELFLMRTPPVRILVRMLANLRYSYGRSPRDPRPAQLERFIRVLLSSSHGK